MSGPKGKGSRYDTFYIDAGGRVHATRESAIEDSLSFEWASGTGVGCNQSSENVSTGSGGGGKSGGAGSGSSGGGKNK